MKSEVVKIKRESEKTLKEEEQFHQNIIIQSRKFNLEYKEIMGCCYSRKTRKIKRVDANETQQKNRQFDVQTRYDILSTSNQNTGNGYGLQDTSYIEETFIEVGMRWKSSSKFVKVEPSQQAELET